MKYSRMNHNIIYDNEVIMVVNTYGYIRK